ncbi:hypothetical protein LguiB_010548 [Lonicera macranthoides]
MDASELNQALKKHIVVESPRPPFVPTRRNNGTTTRSRTKEISSRYMSPNPSSSSCLKRCPSPKTTRSVIASLITVPKRAISAERKRPSTPPSPKSPATPVHDLSIDMHLASRKIIGSRLPESLWPSRMRSLSVSFQSDTFSLPISKREKPVTNALSDRTLKPFSNVSHKESQHALRKPTPERKRSPLKGRQAVDQSENSKPFDSLHSRLVDQHRWPSRTGLKVSSNGSNTSSKTMDLNIRTTKASTPPHPRRMSLPGNMSKPVQKSFDGSGRVEFEAYSIDDNRTNIPKIISSSSSEIITPMTPVLRSQSLPCSGSRPQSPNKLSLLSSSVCRGASPSRTRALNPGPARGISPSRIRPSSPTRQSNSSGSTSVLSFIADIKKGKKVANHIEDVHQLRLLYNGHLQWRYTNAQVDEALHSQQKTAERTLYNVWRTTSELWESVTKKRFDLQQLRLKLKLYSILNEQMEYLNEWASIEREHSCALSGSIKDLQASTLHLPVTGGAMADIETVKLAVCSAVDLMQTMGSSVCSILSRVEGMNCLVSELADVAAQERAILDECEALLATTEAMQVEENSLRTHLLQLQQQAWKNDE